MKCLSTVLFFLLATCILACSDLQGYGPACPTTRDFCVASRENEALYYSCFDTVQRSPLFVVHKIVRDRCKDGKRCKGNWHVFSPEGDRTSHEQLVHEQGSGAAFADQSYQRGHFAPAGDFRAIDADCKATFATVNRAPQAGKLNGAKWAHMENAFRAANERLGEDLVILTGATYETHGKTTKEKDGLSIGVPTTMYKVLYSPRNKAAIAAFAENYQDADVKLLSVAQLKKQIGTEVFGAGKIADETNVSWGDDISRFLSEYMNLDSKAYGRALHRLSMDANNFE